MSGYIEVSTTMLWSGQMILRTLQKMLAENAYNNLPTAFIKEMETLKTVLTLEQLKLKLEALANICLTELGVVAGIYDFDSLIKDIVEIRKLEEFPMFLGLDGCINNVASGDLLPFEPWCERKNIEILRTRKSIMFSVVNMINEYHFHRIHVNFKNCSRIIGYFYADQLARQFKDIYCFGTPNNEFAKTMSTFCQESLKDKIQLTPSETRMKATINSLRLEKLVQIVFKDSNYYLIPEFRYEFAEAKKKTETKTGATLPQFLFDAAITFDRLFEALGKYPIFHPVKFQLTDNAIIAVKVYGYGKHVMFAKSIDQLIVDEYPHMTQQIPPLTDSLAMVDANAFFELLLTEKNTNFLDLRVGTKIHFVRKTFANPVVSPLGQLCLPAFEAVTGWIYVFIENAKFVLFSDNLNALEKYLKKSVKFFTKDKKEYMHAVDYTEFETLIMEGKALYARENKKHAKKSTPTIVEDYEKLVVVSKCANTFPMLLSILQCFSFDEQNAYLEFTNCLQYSLWFKFPELALFAHQQQMCGIISFSNDRKPICYLDYIQDDGFVRPARCDHPIAPVVQLLQDRRSKLEMIFEEKEQRNAQESEKENDLLVEHASNVTKVVDHLQSVPVSQLASMIQTAHEHTKTIARLNGEIEKLTVDAKWHLDKWSLKEKYYESRIEGHIKDLNVITENRDSLILEAKVWKSKEKKYTSESEELRKLRDEVKVLRKEKVTLEGKEKEHEKMMKKKQTEVNTLMSKLRESMTSLEEVTKLQKARDIEYQKECEKQKMEMRKLEEEVKKLKMNISTKEEEEAGDGRNRKIVKNAKELIKNYEEYQQEWKSQMESARIILQEFTIHSKSKLDVKMAEKELKYYGLITDGWMKMVDENIKMLKGKNIQYELLFEVKVLPSTVFSGGMIEKMEKVRKEKMEEEQNKKECSICLELLNEENLFKCVGCSKELHANCYAQWEEMGSATCPLCRRTNPNREEFPPLR